MSSNLSIRLARAADVDIAAPLIYSSGPAAFDYVFARDQARAGPFLRGAFADRAGEFGWRNHVVIELDGKAVGVGAAYDGSTGLAFTLAAARQILSQYGPIASAGVIARGLSVEAVIPPPQGKAAVYLAHLAVSPELRSQGLGRRLIEHLMEAAAAKGYRQAALDVSAANPRAQALYERLGFVVTGERRSTLKNRWAEVADHRRMERAL